MWLAQRLAGWLAGWLLRIARLAVRVGASVFEWQSGACLSVHCGDTLQWASGDLISCLFLLLPSAFFCWQREQGAAYSFGRTACKQDEGGPARLPLP